VESVPSDHDYEDMICCDCVAKNPWLLNYASKMITMRNGKLEGLACKLEAKDATKTGKLGIMFDVAKSEKLSGAAETPTDTKIPSNQPSDMLQLEKEALPIKREPEIALAEDQLSEVTVDVESVEHAEKSHLERIKLAASEMPTEDQSVVETRKNEAVGTEKESIQPVASKRAAEFQECVIGHKRIQVLEGEFYLYST
jgi:hypothetical protein